MKSGRLAVVVLALAASAGSALADQINVANPGATYRVQTFGGGSFRVSTLNGYAGEAGGFGGTNSSFLTFCLEKNELVNLGHNYYVTIDTVAKNGGIGGGNPDPLSPVTALLYQEFRDGGNFGNIPQLANNLLDTANEIRSLQRAIWHSEDELPAGEYAADPVAVALYNWAVANNNGSIGNVRVLNLWTRRDNTGNAQDLLTIVPLPTAGWAGIASLAGVFGAGYVRRRGHRANV
jgi:hypothetical protein